VTANDTYRRVRFKLAVVIAIGVWASRRIKNQTDYFVAGRKFGKFIHIRRAACHIPHLGYCAAGRSLR